MKKVLKTDKWGLKAGDSVDKLGKAQQLFLEEHNYLELEEKKKERKQAVKKDKDEAS